MDFRSSIGEEPLDFIGPDFFTEYWEQRTFFVENAIQDTNAVLTMDAFWNVLSASASSATSVPSIVEGAIARPMRAASQASNPYGAACAAYDRGASLLVPALQKSVPSIAVLCRLLDNMFLTNGVHLSQPVFANAYLTPPASKGFGAHYDDHCVVVLQIGGTKHWAVAEPEVELPIDRCTATLPESALQPPVIEVEMKPGDLLYVPRGFPHIARCTDYPSLHITFGVRALTWVEYLPALLKQSGQLRAGVRSNAQFAQEPTPLVDAVTASLLQIDIPGTLSQLLGDRLSSLEPDLRATRDPFAQPSISTSTIVCRRPNIVALAESRNDRALLHFPGGPIELPDDALDVLTFIAERDCFTVGDLPQNNVQFDQVGLARLLIQKLVLTVASNQNAARFVSGVHDAAQ